MRIPLLIIALLLCLPPARGQAPDSTGLDNNPKVTVAESAWLKARFPDSGFDFRGKYIGFIEVTSGGYYGIGKYFFRMQKRHFFVTNPETHLYRLFVLDSAERKATRGYDALVAVVLRKNRGKLLRAKREAVVASALNRYPQFPADAGKDTGALLDAANAAFFNALYRSQIYPEKPFDFTGKKVAIFDTHCRENSVERISIDRYVARVRMQLDTTGYSTTEFTYYLTPEQKAATGGYDVLIQYRCKKDFAVSYLISQLQ